MIQHGPSGRVSVLFLVQLAQPIMILILGHGPHLFEILTSFSHNSSICTLDTSDFCILFLKCDLLCLTLFFSGSKGFSQSKVMRSILETNIWGIKIRIMNFILSLPIKSFLYVRLKNQTRMFKEFNKLSTMLLTLWFSTLCL